MWLGRRSVYSLLCNACWFQDVPAHASHRSAASRLPARRPKEKPSGQVHGKKDGKVEIGAIRREQAGAVGAFRGACQQLVITELAVRHWHNWGGWVASGAGLTKITAGYW